MIILNYNSFEDTSKLTLSLVHSNLDLIIVDNASMDNSYERLRQSLKDYDNIHIIKNNTNYGYSNGNNIGMKYAIENLNPKYFLIANPDIEIDTNFVEKMKSYLDEDSQLAAVTGVMKNINGEINPSLIAWKLPEGFDDIFLNSGFLLSKLRKSQNPVSYSSFDSLPKNNGIHYVDCIPGSCFMIKTDVMERIGFFDENVFLYCEERILAKKIKDIEMKIGISLADFFVHNHKNQEKLKNLLKHQIWLYQSRFYYNIHYTKYGKLISPLIILSCILGLFETLISNI